VSGKRLAVEVLIDLRRRLDPLPSRSRERRDIVRQAADLYGISESTLYRQLEKLYRPKALRRADHGVPRVLTKAQMMRYCEVIAALKIRTMNKKGRYISTVRAIEVLEGQGVETPDGLVNPEKGQLRKATVNRYLKQWGFDHRTLTYQTPAVRFQARHSNECWQFDLSPSDLKHVAAPLWHDPSKGRPLQPRRRPQRCLLSGIPPCVWRRRGGRPAFPVQRHVRQIGRGVSVPRDTGEALHG